MFQNTEKDVQLPMVRDKMILIAHRGNLYGPNPAYENNVEYVQEALALGYNVEIDLWYNPLEKTLYLGHDEPQYLCDFPFLTQRGVWIHCKNIHALEFCNDHHITNPYFWHDQDDTTLTSTKLFWTYPGKPLTKYSIAVMPEHKLFKNIRLCQGICSDFVAHGTDFFYDLHDNGESSAAFQQIIKTRRPSSK